MLALLVLAQSNTDHTAEAPDSGLAFGFIVGIIVLVALAAALGFYLLNRGAKASKGGVEPPPAERDTRHPPPLESVERRS